MKEISNPKIYIISGKARSGKDTSSNYILKYYNLIGKKAIILSYGYYIKEYVKRIISWDGRDETKPRDILNSLGTDIIRKNIDELFFINRMIEDIKVYSYFFDVIIISDARFKDEIEMIKNEFNDIVVMHIERPGFVSALTLEQKEHVCETSLDDYSNYDYIVVNDGSLDDLNKKIVNIVGDVEDER